MEPDSEDEAATADTEAAAINTQRRRNTDIPVVTRVAILFTLNASRDSR